MRPILMSYIIPPSHPQAAGTISLAPTHLSSEYLAQVFLSSEEWEHG